MSGASAVINISKSIDLYKLRDMCAKTTPTTIKVTHGGRVHFIYANCYALYITHGFAVSAVASNGKYIIDVIVNGEAYTYEKDGEVIEIDLDTHRHAD